MDKRKKALTTLIVFVLVLFHLSLYHENHKKALFHANIEALTDYESDILDCFALVDVDTTSHPLVSVRVCSNCDFVNVSSARLVGFCKK